GSQHSTRPGGTTGTARRSAASFHTAGPSRRACAVAPQPSAKRHSFLAAQNRFAKGVLSVRPGEWVAAQRSRSGTHLSTARTRSSYRLDGRGTRSGSGGGV